MYVNFTLTVMLLLWMYTVQNADALCKGIELNSLGQEDATLYCSVITNRLLSARQSGNCAALKCIRPAQDDILDWIQCDGCHMWLHFVCEGITSRPSRTAFRCSVCRLSTC